MRRISRRPRTASTSGRRLRALWRPPVRTVPDRAPLLTFDYRLREGIATTRNALKLLDAVALGGLELEREG